jgi:hypothetical protein
MILLQLHLLILVHLLQPLMLCSPAFLIICFPFSGRSLLWVFVLSRIISTSDAASRNWIPRMTEWFDHFFFCWFLYWDNFTFILVMLNTGNFATMKFYILCLPLSCWDTKGEYFTTVVFLLCLPFFLLRQKVRVFLYFGPRIYFGPGIYFKPVKWFLSQNGQMKSLLVLLAALCLTKSLLCNVVVINRDTVYLRVFKRISEKLFKCSKEDFVQIPT